MRRPTMHNICYFILTAAYLLSAVAYGVLLFEMIGKPSEAQAEVSAEPPRSEVVE